MSAPPVCALCGWSGPRSERELGPDAQEGGVLVCAVCFFASNYRVAVRAYRRHVLKQAR